MTQAQLEAILAELRTNSAYGWTFVIDEGVYVSTRDYTFEIVTMGGVATLVGTSKTSDTNVYVEIGSIRAVKQLITPKHSNELAPAPYMPEL